MPVKKVITTTSKTTSVTRRGRALRIGDQVAIRSGSSKPYIAQIEDFGAPSKRKSNAGEPKEICLSWFYYPEDVPANVKSKEAPIDFLPNELICSDHSDWNPITTIENPVRIFFGTSASELNEHSKAYDYVCRWKYYVDAKEMKHWSAKDQINDLADADTTNRLDVSDAANDRVGGKMTGNGQREAEVSSQSGINGCVDRAEEINGISHSPSKREVNIRNTKKSRTKMSIDVQPTIDVLDVNKVIDQTETTNSLHREDIGSQPEGKDPETVPLASGDGEQAVASAGTYHVIKETRTEGTSCPEPEHAVDSEWATLMDGVLKRSQTTPPSPFIACCARCKREADTVQDIMLKKIESWSCRNLLTEEDSSALIDAALNADHKFLLLFRNITDEDFLRRHVLRLLQKLSNPITSSGSGGSVTPS